MTLKQIMQIPSGNDGIAIKSLKIGGESQLPYLLPVWVSDDSQIVGFISEKQKASFIKQAFYKYTLNKSLFKAIVKDKKLNIKTLSNKTCGNYRTIEKKLANNQKFDYKQAWNIACELEMKLDDLFDEKKPTEDENYVGK